MQKLISQMAETHFRGVWLEWPRLDFAQKKACEEENFFFRFIFKNPSQKQMIISHVVSGGPMAKKSVHLYRECSNLICIGFSANFLETQYFLAQSIQFFMRNINIPLFRPNLTPKSSYQLTKAHISAAVHLHCLDAHLDSS